MLYRSPDGSGLKTAGFRPAGWGATHSIVLAQDDDEDMDEVTDQRCAEATISHRCFQKLRLSF